MTNCDACKRRLLDGEHCYGPVAYEGQESPDWVLCIGCHRKYVDDGT